jgi:hypothetical protein
MAEQYASVQQIKMMWALEKKLGRVPKWREGVTQSYAQSLIEELQGEMKASGLEFNDG